MLSDEQFREAWPRVVRVLAAWCGSLAFHLVWRERRDLSTGCQQAETRFAAARFQAQKG